MSRGPPSLVRASQRVKGCLSPPCCTQNHHWSVCPLSDMHYTVIRRWGASLVAQRGENLTLMLETQIRVLGWKDSPEKEMATHSNIFAWKIPQTEEPGRLQATGSQGSDTTEPLNHYHYTHQKFTMFQTRC